MKAILPLLFLATSLLAQTDSTVRVSLQIVPGILQPMGRLIEIKTDAVGKLTATLPGGIEAHLERTPSPLAGVILAIPGAEPPSLALMNGQQSTVSLNRSLGNLKSTPYMISYLRSERDGKISETLFWLPFYRAQGKLKLPNCEIGVVVYDFNGDGVFDREEGRVATTIGLDVNNDGVFWGAAEYRKIEEVIDVCGTPLQISDLDPAGASITFRPSQLAVPKVESPIPAFSVETNKGQLVRSSDFRDRVTVLDFWASWCAPCVAKLVAMESVAREHAAKVSVIGINVDEPDRRAAAEKLIQEKSLSFPQIIRAQGEKDFLWKLFGSMQDVRLSIPLYVVVDAKGVIRYASVGGDELTELHQVLDKLLTATRN